MAWHLQCLLLIVLLPLLITGQQSIQGFIYWDEDFNGVLTEGVLNPYGIYVRELENGVVNVRIEVNRCGSGELVTKGLSGWLSTAIEVPTGSTNIHSSAGYYKIDVGENADESGLGGCLLDDEDLSSINGGSEDDDGADSSKGNGGCYLVVSSPKDMEITTTFPLPYSHGFYGSGSMKSKEMDSIEDDIFSWRRYKDIGPFTEDASNGSDVVNRGYQTRTTECFGYNTDNSKWYVWKDPLLVDEDSESAKAMQVDIPNSRIYGYDRYLTLNSYNYDGVLSISPIGMIENLWPLPLRVKSDVYLGMQFRESNALKGRFQYKPTSVDEATAASTYQPYQALTTSDEVAFNVFSSDGADTTDGYFLENPDGILADFSNFEDVIQSFLKQTALDPSRGSGLEQMMISLNTVGVDQWSMVKITDSKAPSGERRHLRGLRSKQSQLQYTSSSSNFRAGGFDHRTLIMSEPHMIFHFQVYATYSSRASAEVSSIIQTVDSFGRAIEHAINTKNQDLLLDIRKRTGFDGPECTVTSSSDTNATSLESYSIIEFDSGPDSDSSKPLSCSDRIPLYYYDISTLESRGATNHNASLYEKIGISTALKALTKPSQAFGVSSVEEETDSSRNHVLIYAALSALAGISIAAFGVGWVIYERKRRAKLRRQKRLRKKQRRAKRMRKNLLDEKAGSGSLEKSNSSNALETSHKSSDERASEEKRVKLTIDDSSDEDSEIERLFDDSLKTKATDLEQSNFNLSHNASRQSGIDISSPRESEGHSQKGNAKSMHNRHDKKTKLRVTRSQNAATSSNRFSSAMAGLRQSTTHMILGKLDTSDSDSDSSDDSSSSSSSSSESEAEDHENKAGRPSKSAPTRNRRRVISSVIDNVRSSITRAKNPMPEPPSRKKPHRTAVSKIRSSLKKTKKNPIPKHDSSSSSSSDDDSSSDSSAENGLKKREESHFHHKPDIRSGSSSSDSSVDSHKPDRNVASRPTINRRASDSGPMMKRNHHDVHDVDKHAPNFRAKSLPDASSVVKEDSDEDDVKKSFSHMQSDGAPKQNSNKSIPSSRPSLQKRQSHRHVTSSRGDGTKMHKHASERKLEVPLHELKPSKAKSSRQSHRDASTRLPKENIIDRGQAMAKAKSNRQLKTEDQLDNQELHDSVVTNKQAYLPQDLKPTDEKREHGPHPPLSRTNSDRSKSSNDLEKSSNSRLSSRPSTKSDLEEGKERKSRKSRKGQTVKKIAKDTVATKPDPPAESSENRQRRRRTRIEKLKSSLKSSMSTFSGNKLSGAATSTLTEADTPHQVKHVDQKVSKARSMKSSRSVLASEKSSSNLNAKVHHKSTRDGTRRKRATTRH